ncbi:hypothetical protein [Algoriphagus sp.]|uniref:hypothetical protein n=1 Tax=Algoriphagus sp. TaxID=1872435 RepID=UPI0032764756
MSNFLDDLFNKVFKTSGKTPIYHKENIVLKEEELADAIRWMESAEGLGVFARISKSYHFKTIQIEEHPQVHIMNSKYARGFAVSYDEPLDQQTFSLLFLAFAQRVLALGYRQVSLDRKIEEINEVVKVTDKFYLKPPLAAWVGEKQLSQLYGNISIEKITINNQPSYIKVLASFYSDRQYQDPQPFDQFIDHLLEATS